MKRYQYVFRYIFWITFALLCIIIVEGVFTVGNAFKFEEYPLIAWIGQVLLITCVLAATIGAVSDMDDKSTI